MPTRIPLVPAAPSDGKQYVQKDGVWVVPPVATTTDSGLFSKEDKAKLDQLAADGGGKSDIEIAKIADGNTLHDKDGAALTDKDGDPILLGSRGDLPQALGKNGMVHEYGMFVCQSNAWNSKSVTVGGMTFYWSAAANNTGSLMWRRATRTDAPVAQVATQFWNKRASGGYPTCYSSNLAAWPKDPVTLTTDDAQSLSGAYASVEVNITTRNYAGVSAYWRINAMSTGSSTLSVVVEYFGPRYQTIGE
jgi:hypothetical protein